LHNNFAEVKKKTKMTNSVTKKLVNLRESSCSTNISVS